MHFNTRTIALAVIAACATSAHAEDAPASSSVRFSGFGTLGAVRTNTGLADYGDPLQGGNAGKGVNLGVDSKLGVQVDASLNSMFSATGQVLSKLNAQGNWDPKVEWAFIKAKLGSGFEVRLGRVGTPWYMVSDFREVNYANLWLRPPMDVYGQVPFSWLDGVDVSYQGDFSGTNLRAQVFVGDTKRDLGPLGNLKGRNFFGFNLLAEYGPFTLRAGHAQGKIDLTSNPGLNQLFGGLRLAGQAPGLGALVTLADKLCVDDKDGSFSGVGLSFDWKNIVGSAEFGKRRSDSLFADTTSWYSTVGYRMGQWTPYLTVSRTRQDSETSSSVVPSAIPALAPLAAGVNAVLADTGQKTIAIGGRWDVYENIAIKAQFDRIKVDAGGSGGRGFFKDVKPGFGADKVNVYSVAVDFIF